MRISSRVWMIGQCGYLTHCEVAVKPQQSSGFYPWQRSAGSYSNLSIKNIITQSAFALQVTENACTCRQSRLLSHIHVHTRHFHFAISLTPVGWWVSHKTVASNTLHFGRHQYRLLHKDTLYCNGLRPPRSYNPCSASTTLTASLHTCLTESSGAKMLTTIESATLQSIQQLQQGPDETL